MDKRELVKRLMATYLEELDEHVSTLNRDLLALEEGPPAEQRVDLLQSLFRAAHSLKGASRAVDVGLIEQVCHALEDLLSAVRDGDRELDKASFALMFRAADAIEEAGMRLREEQPLEGGPLSDLLPVISAMVSGESSAGPAESGPATPAGEACQEADSPPPEAADAAPAPEAADAVPAATPSDSVDDSPPASSEVPASPVVSKAPALAANVRVAAEKLDALLAQVGELLVVRRQVGLRVDELESLRDAITVWQRDWRVQDNKLQQLLHSADLAIQESPLTQALLAALHANASRLKEFEKQLERLVHDARADFHYFSQVSSTIENDVHDARMLPFAEACQGLQRAVRDVAESSDKKVQLRLVGGNVQVDRSVLEGLKSPLLHLVRNAVDHGIETRAQRQDAGKNPQASIVVEATLRGANVEVSVTDDGRGLDLQRIADKAASRGLKVPQDPHEVARMIFLPAFSTAAEVSDVSGRGVGLDVVRAEIERLHGSVEVTFEPDQGTRFQLAVPLTLTTIRAIMVSCGGQTFAIPTGNVDRVERFDAAQHTTVGGRHVLLRKGSPIALTDLAGVLGLSHQWSWNHDEKMLAVILVSGGQRVAFAIDELQAEDELTVKSLGPRVRRLRHVSGATFLATGEIALVLNAANLIRTAVAKPLVLQQVTSAEPAETVQASRLLVVDDSITTRTLLRSILEAAGYDVSVAADGQQALDMVATFPYDLVVSDIDMPRLDGIQFTEALRSSPATRDLPVVLITARGSEQDRARGVQAGANAYMVKSGFDQSRLMQVIAELL